MDNGNRNAFYSGQRSVRGAAWRSLAAQELANSGSRRSSPIWDRLTLDTATYLAQRSNGVEEREQALRRFPHIAAAIALNEDSSRTDTIKLLILVDETVNAAAGRVGLDPRVVETWEQLFFDVRSLRRATSWMSIFVIEKERAAGNTALAARMQLALVAGADAVRALLDMDDRAPVDEAELLFQRRLQLNLKLREVAGLPIDSERCRLTLIKSAVDLQLAEKRLELDGQKLAARCATDCERHKLAEMRLQDAQERAEQQVREKKQRAERRRLARERRRAELASAHELSSQAGWAAHQAAISRAAQSPLARLAWGRAKPEPPEPSKLFASQAPFETEMAAESIHRAVLHEHSPQSQLAT